jgi:DNA replication ATP-dependent helicase Dna2
MPGSGKTSTISFVARLLAAHGKRVLITSYTHAAVDTLLLKMMDCDVGTVSNNLGLYDMVRLGQESQVHDKVRSITVSKLAAEYEQRRNKATKSGVLRPTTLKPSLEALQHIMDAACIVGVSALSIPRTPLLSRVHFDVVIVDEAGQISQPAVLGAIIAAEKFVLVGDHEQLPPLVQNQLAEQGGKSQT